MLEIMHRRLGSRSQPGLAVLVAVFGLAFVGLARFTPAADPGVFDAPPAPTTPILREGVPTAGGPLRRLTVEERVGLARKNELVRAPLFFHPDECRDPNALALYDLADLERRQPIPYQADDIRRDPSGAVGRMHIYFAADIAPWQRRQFVLYRGANPAAKATPIPMREQGDQVAFSADGLQISFLTKGPRAGAIAALSAPFAKIRLVDGYMGPAFRLVRQDAKCKDLRTTEISYAKPEGLEVRELRYDTGPLFAKLRVKIGPVGVPDSAEVTYQIPKTGSTLVVTQRTFPEGPVTDEVVSSKWPVILAGNVVLGEDPAGTQVVKVPMGLRRLTRFVQNQNAEAAVADKAGFSILNAPQVAGGQVYYQNGNELVVMGSGRLHRTPDGNSASIRAFWAQTRCVLAPTTDPEKLWDQLRIGQQALVAIVDEPGVTADDLEATLRAVSKSFYEIKNWGRGWQQTAAMDYLTGNEASWHKLLARAAAPPAAKDAARDESHIETWVPSWVQPQLQKLPPLDRAKGKLDTARLDPYMIGYGESSMVPFAAFLSPSDRLDHICYAVGKGSMLTNGGVYANGFPRINAFSNALNMQIGSMYFGIYAGKKLHDDWMVQFYRDAAHSPGVLGIYGHGERSYSSDVRNGETSDFLYQGISDLWLRSIELTCNEDLLLHPTVFSRYVDCVDVTADLQHASLNPKRESWSRADFFRGQSHDHRWEAWDAAPYTMMLHSASDDTPPGLTDTVYYTRGCEGSFVNWSRLMNFFHALVDLKVARLSYQPPQAPLLPAEIKVQAAPSGGVQITWQPVPGDVAGYRVYRADRVGEPMTLLNSPYAPDRQPLIKAPPFTDAQGTPQQFYFVTALNRQGYESRWFADEPLPLPGKNATTATTKP